MKEGPQDDISGFIRITMFAVSPHAIPSAML
jgi:hypothetical protein